MKNRKKLLVFTSVFVLCMTSVMGEDHQIKLALDKADGIYRKGETVKLAIDYRIDGKEADGPLKIEATRQDNSREEFKFDAEKKVFPFELKKGAVRFRVSALDADGKVIHQKISGKKPQPVSSEIGAIADPKEITAGFQEPADFQQFWDQAKAELAKVPVKASRKEVDVPKKQQGKFRLWDVQVDCAGNAPVSGYLTMPVNAAPKSLPAVVSFQGAGVGSGWKIFTANAIHFNINAHGITNGQPAAFYKDLRENALKNYSRRDADSREKFYFRNMFIRVLRSLEYVKTLPEYDGKTLIVTGSSQGGAQAIVAAALDPDVVLLDARVPAMCDHGGILVGRRSGWPQLIRLKKGKVANPKVAETLPYYDMVFFAKRVKAEVYFTAGLIDRTCCPSSVYAAFNAIPGKKVMTTMPSRGHVGDYSEAYKNRLAEIVGKGAKK